MPADTFQVDRDDFATLTADNRRTKISIKPQTIANEQKDSLTIRDGHAIRRS